MTIHILSDRRLPISSSPISSHAAIPAQRVRSMRSCGRPQTHHRAKSLILYHRNSDQSVSSRYLFAIERCSALRYQVFQAMRCQSQSGSLCSVGLANRVPF